MMDRLLDLFWEGVNRLNDFLVHSFHDLCYLILYRSLTPPQILALLCCFLLCQINLLRVHLDFCHDLFRTVLL